MGFFDQAVCPRRSWLGPDFGFTLIEGFQDGHMHFMQSWHEQFESNTNLVVIDGWAEPLDGRSRDSAIKNWSAEYRNFRRLWSDVRLLAAEFVKRAEQKGDTRH